MTSEEDVQWIVPIVVGAAIPFIVMFAGRIGQSQKSTEASVIHIANLKTDVADIHTQLENIKEQQKKNLDRFTDEVNKLFKAIDDLRADLKVCIYRLDKIDKTTNGKQG